MPCAGARVDRGVPLSAYHRHFCAVPLTRGPRSKTGLTDAEVGRAGGGARQVEVAASAAEAAQCAVSTA